MFSEPYEIIVLPCGKSWAENIRYRIYYKPSSRRHTRDVQFIGIYKDKEISYIGEILGSCVGTPKNGELIVEEKIGHVSAEDIKKIEEVISVTPYFKLNKESVRYYLMSKFHEVNIQKDSDGGVRGSRYLDLQVLSQNTITPEDTIEQIADKVRGSSFS